MRRRIRCLVNMKARYPATILLLIGVTSLITWSQSGDGTSERILKSLQSKIDNTATKLTANGMKTPVDGRDTHVMMSPPSKIFIDDAPPIFPFAGSSSSTIAPVSEAEKKEYYEEFFNSPAFKSSDGRPKQNTGNFLLPVLFFDVGPNNLYRLFKETIPIANAMGRTLVVPPFHRHPRMENFVRGRKISRDNPPGSSERVIDIPIFDQTYTVSLETNPTKSFDMKTLRYIVPAESMERFSRSCTGETTTMLVCGELDEKRRRGIDLFKIATKMKFGRTVEVDTLSDVTEDKTWKVNLANANQLLGGSKCASLAIGRNCLGSKEAWLRQWKSISPFVRRPVPVKILAKKFIADMMSNQDFLAIHWRYDQIDWNDMCKPSRPESARKRNKQICELSSELDTEESALLRMGKKIVRFMRKSGFRKAYLAGPPQLNATIHKLRARTPGLYTINDVREYANMRSSSTGFFETNYMMSFLEQEICYLSKKFLASPLSSWSQSVLLDRMAEDRPFESVLDVLVDGKSGFPKLSWLFPEGDWR